MARIETYAKDLTLSDKDKVIGSNYVNTVNGVDQFTTTNFTLKQLTDYIGPNVATGNLNIKANGGIVEETINNVDSLAVDLGASSITGQLANSNLANSSITINGTAISLGGTVTTPDTQLSDAQVRSKISVTGGGSYNSSTGVITIPAAFTLATGNVTNASVSGQTLTLTRQSTSDVTFTPTANDFTNTLKTKLDNIESNATADQTAAEIRTLVDAATDSNVFTDNDHTKLDNIEANATADQTASEIKSLYEGNSDTNAFTDADHTKLDGIAAGAEVNVQANWNESTSTSDAFIQNKPTLFVGTDISASTDNDAKGITVTANAASATIGLDVDGLTELTTADFNDDFLVIYDNNVATNKKIHPENIIPEATSSRRGGIKIGYTESGKNYPVELDSEKAYVNVPWTDTIYTLPTASSSTLGGVKVGGNLTIDGDGVLNVGAIALTTVQTAANQTAHLALTAQEGDIVVRSDQNKSYVHNGGTAGTMADYTLLLTPTDAVLSVTTSDGTYINLTPNSAATGAITVTADLSATNGTSDTTTRFLSQDNTWDVPSYTTDLDHDSLTNYVANEHIDWTTDQGGTNIHTGNYNNTQLSNAEVIAAIVASTSISGSDKGTIRSNIGAGSSSFSGDYDDLTNKPTLLELGTTSTTALAGNTTTISSAQSTKLGHISVTQAVDLDTIESNTATNNAKTSFPGFGTTSGTALEGDTSLFSGDYDDLSNKPTIPSGNQIIDWTTDQGSTNIHTGNYNNTTYSDGDGLDLNGTVFSHTDTSSQSSVNNSGRTYIQDITLDTYGHVTGLTSATETVTNSFRTIEVDGTSIGSTTTLDLVAGNNITLSESNGEVTIDATDTNTDTNTTYDLSVHTGTTKIRLAGSDGTNDDVEIFGGTNVTVTRNNANKLTIASTDTNTQLSTAQVRAKFTAGSNITITNGEIAATNTTYTAGHGLTLSGTEFQWLYGIETTQVTATVNNVSTTAGRYYRVQADDQDRGELVVNVPWTDNNDNTNILSGGTITGDVTVNGDMTFEDGHKLELGTGADLDLYHTSNNSYIDNNTGNLYIRCNPSGEIHLRPKESENGIIVRNDGKTELYFDNAKKLETVTGGVNVTGTMTASADVVAYSDERLKSDIKTLDGSKVYDMRGVSFIKDNKQSSGVIAQELEKIAPELVNNEGEYKAVAYGNVVGYLIEAIKDLKAEIEILKNGGTK